MVKRFKAYFKNKFLQIILIYENWRLSKYYLSIHECPAYNWNLLFEEKDFSKISRSGKVCKRVTTVYERLQDQMIDEFGINEDLMKIIKNKIKIEILYADQIETGDRSTQWKIEFLELDNVLLQGKQTKSDFFATIMYINAHVKVDYKTITMYEMQSLQKRIANKLKHEK